MRRALMPIAALLVVLLMAPADSSAAWQSQQPIAAGTGVPVPLGQIGDVEFWAPNRGMLITAGNGGVAPGLFAYDGSSWYRYSTVCGGTEGRIAWAGPNEFWTVSDQQAGQQTGEAPPQQVSLCHFKNGQVVASYGEPVGQATSYQAMSAATCASPSNCWFGGKRLPSGALNDGAFHLHWNGSTVTPVPSTTNLEPELGDPGRSVVSIARYRDRFYESVAVRAGDEASGESEDQPSFLHQIVPGPSPFAPVPVHGTIDYGAPGATAEELQGFQLSPSSDALWAVSGAESEPAGITALLKSGDGPFEPVPLSDPGGILEAGDGVGGLAAEPGANSAWVSFRRLIEFDSAGPARLARIHDDGSVDEEVVLPTASETIGNKGTAGPIACPATGQCWMATSRGWLFHLGPNPLQDTDPLLHTLVTFRPPDRSLPAVPPISLPVDDSGAYKAAEGPIAEEEPEEKRAPALYYKLRQRVLDGNILELSFTLRAKAKVQLFAKREGKIIAKTPRRTLTEGRHSLRLQLDPGRWPTKLDLEVRKVETKKR